MGQSRALFFRPGSLFLSAQCQVQAERITEYPKLERTHEDRRIPLCKGVMGAGDLRLPSWFGTCTCPAALGSEGMRPAVVLQCWTSLLGGREEPRLTDAGAECSRKLLSCKPIAPHGPPSTHCSTRETQTQIVLPLPPRTRRAPRSAQRRMLLPPRDGSGLKAGGPALPPASCALAGEGRAVQHSQLLGIPALLACAIPLLSKLLLQPPPRGSEVPRSCRRCGAVLGAPQGAMDSGTAFTLATSSRES